MISMTIGLVAVVVAVVFGVVMITVVGVPLAILLAVLLGLIPWLLGLAAVVLFIKALFEKPMTLESFAPAGIALVASVILRGIF